MNLWLKRARNRKELKNMVETVKAKILGELDEEKFQVRFCEVTLGNLGAITSIGGGL